MCGIAGFFGVKRSEDSVIERTLSLMRRRGPDHRSSVTLPCGERHFVSLLHSRLSIIDLDKRAHQPFLLNGCTLIFNGEIYNYLELKQVLEEKGVIFRTSSDTEVLLRSYLNDPDGFLDSLEGMWAFALYDSRSQTLLLSRDRMGEKPLYWFQTPEGLYFGSEPKFIFSLSGRRPTVNKQQISRFLVNGYKSLYKQNDTFFENLNEVPAGHCLRVGQAGVSGPAPYWKLAFCEKMMSYEDAVKGVSDRLENSLRIRLRADVPLAFCLSGGVDSSALVSIAAKRFGSKVSTFSIIDDDERYNEEKNIIRTVKDVGCENQTIRLSRHGFWDRMRQLVQYHDAPVATISYYVHSYLAEAIAQKGYKIALSGTGADELFTGYFDHYNMYLYERRDQPAFAGALSDWQATLGSVVRNPHLKNPRLFLEDPDFRGHIYLDSEIFQSYMVSKPVEEFFEQSYAKPLLRNRMMNELLHEVVPVILHEDDLNSMYYSIENRSPYLDRSLVEFAYQIPTEHLIRQGRTKCVLRDAVKGILNEEVRWDPHKKGFNASILTLVDLKNPRDRAALTEDSPIMELVDRKRMESLLNEDYTQNSFSKFLFSFISAKMFMETYG